MEDAEDHMPRMAIVAHQDAVDDVLVAAGPAAATARLAASVREKIPEKFKNPAHGSLQRGDPFLGPLKNMGPIGERTGSIFI
jgi:hypothetical protein